MIVDNYVDKAVDHFFPEDAKRARKELMGERKVRRDARQERQQQQQATEQRRRGVIGNSIRIYLTNGRPLRQLVIDSDSSSDTDVSWSPHRASSPLRASPSSASSLSALSTSTSSSSPGSPLSSSVDSSTRGRVGSSDVSSESEEGGVAGGEAEGMDSWSEDDDETLALGEEDGGDAPETSEESD
jgi:hypothetical protein